MAFILASGLTGALQAFAQVDPNDEQSVRMGAQLYDLYCSDCHGVDASGRYGELYDTDDADSDVSEDYAELVELVRGAGAPEPVAAPQADWPEWADNPAPEAEEDVRAEVLGTVTGAIDRMHEAVEDSDPVGAWDDEDAYTNFGGFDPVPGATNLADPTAFFHGTSAEEMFDSIANGTGAAMPGWRTELGSDDAIWDLVNYIRSLWGEEWQF
ncbi:MAG: c-type cytochrome [Halioglobus sp.]|nr:c-type cytochrome [Halioglobus sp.]